MTIPQYELDASAQAERGLSESMRKQFAESLRVYIHGAIQHNNVYDDRFAVTSELYALLSPVQLDFRQYVQDLVAELHRCTPVEKPERSDRWQPHTSVLDSPELSDLQRGLVLDHLADLRLKEGKESKKKLYPDWLTELAKAMKMNELDAFHVLTTFPQEQTGDWVLGAQRHAWELVYAIAKQVPKSSDEEDDDTQPDEQDYYDAYKDMTGILSVVWPDQACPVLVQQYDALEKLLVAPYPKRKDDDYYPDEVHRKPMTDTLLVLADEILSHAGHAQGQRFLESKLKTFMKLPTDDFPTWWENYYDGLLERLQAYSPLIESADTYRTIFSATDRDAFRCLWQQACQVLLGQIGFFKPYNIQEIPANVRPALIAVAQRRYTHKDLLCVSRFASETLDDGEFDEVPQRVIQQYLADLPGAPEEALVRAVLYMKPDSRVHIRDIQKIPKPKTHAIPSPIRNDGSDLSWLWAVPAVEAPWPPQLQKAAIEALGAVTHAQAHKSLRRKIEQPRVAVVVRLAAVRALAQAVPFMPEGAARAGTVAFLTELLSAYRGLPVASRVKPTVFEAEEIAKALVRIPESDIEPLLMTDPHEAVDAAYVKAVASYERTPDVSRMTRTVINLLIDAILFDTMDDQGANKRLAYVLCGLAPWAVVDRIQRDPWSTTQLQEGFIAKIQELQNQQAAQTQVSGLSLPDAVRARQLGRPS